MNIPERMQRAAAILRQSTLRVLRPEAIESGLARVAMITERYAERMQHAAAIFRRNTLLVLQTEAAECGLACLAMIAGRYGHRVDLPELRQRNSLSLRGATLHDLGIMDT